MPLAPTTCHKRSRLASERPGKIQDWVLVEHF